MELKVREMTELESKSTQQVEKSCLINMKLSKKTKKKQTQQRQNKSQRLKKLNKLKQPKQKKSLYRNKKQQKKPLKLQQRSLSQMILKFFHILNKDMESKQILLMNFQLKEKKLKSYQRMQLLTLNIKKKQEEELATM